MPLSFPTTEHLHKLWGGPPGPQPTPSSACSRLDETDLMGEQRVQGDPRGPGVRPTTYTGFPVLGKLSGIAHSCVPRRDSSRRMAIALGANWDRAV